MAIRVQIVTSWVQVTPTYNVSKAVLDYPGSWGDVTGQPDENILPAPNVVIFEGVVSEATFAQIQADELLGLADSPVILFSEVVEDAP